jgi:hypothetical protein
VRVKLSLLILYLAIKCHVLSVVKLTSFQHKELKVWQVEERCQVGQTAKQKMSQQAVAGCGGGRGGRGKPRYYPRLGELKGFKSPISKIAHDTFNTGQNKFAAQFTQLQKDVANYLQCTVASEEYLVAETMGTSRKQVIDLPSAIDPNDPELEDKKII